MNYNFPGNSASTNGVSSSRYYQKSSNHSPEPRYGNNLPHHSSSYSGGSSTKMASSSSHHHDHESRAQSLSQQLAAAQSQVLRLETELSNVRTAKTQAEHRLISLQHENKQIQKRNTEVFDVMKTLESGVEALQREKNGLLAERDELKAKLEASEKNAAVLTEQVSYLNERNSTLSKKCVDLLNGSKDFREKANACEDELKKIKPRFEEMETKFGALSEQNKNFSTRLSMYEMRERIWIREKTELEERQKTEVENWQKMIAGVRQKHEMDMAALRLHTQTTQQRNFNSNPTPPSPAPQGQSKAADIERIEQRIKDFQQLLDSIQRHHLFELNKYQMRIEQLEKVAVKPTSLPTVNNSNNGDDYDAEKILDQEDDDMESVLKSEVTEKEAAALLDENDDDDIILLDPKENDDKNKPKSYAVREEEEREDDQKLCEENPTTLSSDQ